ncbi:MAG: hypothetical protein ABSF64_34515 [Bryobacteraceae bacterium]|jgi:hypothetical protein
MKAVAAAGIPSPPASPIRPPAVAAADDGRLAQELAAGISDTRGASLAPGVRAAPVRGRGARWAK